MRVLRKPGVLPEICPRPKHLKGLPRATQHGSRPNLRQRDPRVELCPLPLTFRIKVRARRDESEKEAQRTSTRTPISVGNRVRPPSNSYYASAVLGEQRVRIIDCVPSLGLILNQVHYCMYQVPVTVCCSPAAPVQ